ncbi:MAG: hotdog fold thioesterase [Saprospiraceae bacterium]|nr:hotdog fold thioesterase [Bacteroidia bacterium]NNL91518.1 hotdog fold thioesterase [Saprospiraceae bacterium]
MSDQDNILTPDLIVKKMYDNDDFSQWLGIEFLNVAKGSCSIKMTVRTEMTNGFNVAHGGISFSLADSAFAFASNSLGKHAVSIETSISHVKPVFVGDILIAIAEAQNVSNSLAIFSVKVKNQDDKTVALFKGTVFRKNEYWT